MKQNIAAWAGILGLVLAVTGCVQLDTEPAPSSAAPGSAVDLPVISSSPAPVVPELEPYSEAGLDQRVKAMSEKSVASQLRAGGHPIDDAVPGTEKILVADTFSGEYYAALPTIADGNHMMIMLNCQKSTRFTVEVYGDPDGTQVASGNSECNHQGSSGIGFGWSPNLTPTYMRIAPAGDEKIEVTVLSYEPVEVTG